MKSGGYIFNKTRYDFCGELNSERIKNKFFPYPDKRDKCVNEIIFWQKIISNLLNSRRFPVACCGELQYLAQFMKRTVDCCKYSVSSIHCFDVFSFPVWRTNEYL